MRYGRRLVGPGRNEDPLRDCPSRSAAAHRALFRADMPSRHRRATGAACSRRRRFNKPPIMQKLTPSRRPATATAIAQGANQVDRNMLFLSSPEFMRR